MKVTPRQIMIAIACGIAIIGAAAVGYAVGAPDEQRSEAVGSTDVASTAETFTTRAKPTTTASSSRPTTATSDTTSTAASPTTRDRDGETALPPPGVAAQVTFPMGGADGGDEPSCAAESVQPGGVFVWPSDSVDLLDTTVVCFVDLTPDQPVLVEVTAPDGALTTETASVMEDPYRGSVPFVDVTRGPGDLAGVYNVSASQGTEARSASVLVSEPSRPLIDVVELSADSLIVAAVGFAPSQPTGVHLYRRHDEVSSIFDWVQSSNIDADQRGHWRIQLSIPTSSGPSHFAVLTSPVSVAAYDRGLDHIVFRRPG